MPFVVATLVRSWAIDALRERDAVQRSLTANADYRQESLREAESGTQNTKDYVASSLQEIKALRQNIHTTESLINQAQHEFRENAPSPFWDRIQDSIIQLSTCQENLKELSRYAEMYSSNLRGRQHNFPQFPVSTSLVPDLRSLSFELHRVICQGQTTDNFSMNFEIRRTREAIIAGFKSLGEALDNVGASVDRSMTTFLSQLNETLNQTKR